MLVQLTAVCLMAAAQSYAVPAESLYSVLRVEGGWIGLAKPNLRKDGTVRSEDLGPFQINTSWLPTFVAIRRGSRPDRSAKSGIRQSGHNAGTKRWLIQQT